MATSKDLMRTFTLWSASSIVAGGGLWAAGHSQIARSFGRQTLAWGVVNAAIVMYGRSRPDPDPARLRKILMINTLADVGYISVGAWLLRKQRYRGDGAAVVAQGGFLLAMDSHYAYHLQVQPAQP